MPDIREEFEAWQVETGRTDPIWFGAASFDDRKREYVLDQINRDWIVWQASRAALVIEMPPCVTAEDVAEHLDIDDQEAVEIAHMVNGSIAACAAFIQQAGIEVKNG